MDVMEMEQRVLKGAKLLDEVRPGWADEIDLATLDMGVGSQANGMGACVLCQMSLKVYPELEWGSYVRGLGWLMGSSSETSDLDDAFGIAHGFEVDEPGRDDGYHMLNVLWTEQIRDRQT